MIREPQAGTDALLARHHTGILILPHVIAADLTLVAEAIHQLANDPDTFLDTALYEWTPARRWRRWPHRGAGMR